MGGPIDRTDSRWIELYERAVAIGNAERGRLLMVCDRCGEPFTAQRATARYCGAACRVAAARARRRASTGPADRTAAARAAIETKRQQRHERDCDVCGAPMVLDGTQINQVYCSAACRQKAYRQRRQARPPKDWRER